MYCIIEIMILVIYLFIYLFNKAVSLNNWHTLESLVSNSTVHSLEGSLIQFVQFACYMNECCMNN